MPLLDHFRPPVTESAEYCEVNVSWATRIADRLMEQIPPDFRAMEYAKAAGGVEIDIATYRRPGAVVGSNGAGNPNLTPDERTGWGPPPPTHTIPGLFPERVEVRVIRLTGGRQLVAAIELVSPANKDRPDERRWFATKVASYLADGVSVIVIDVVTTRRANLHNEIVRLIDAPRAAELPPEVELYAASYRPALDSRTPVIDIWTVPFGIGDSLPTMPLRLTGDLFVPVEFEPTYTDACRKRKLIP